MSFWITYPDGKYNSWPIIVKAKNGDIIVFYSKGSQHVNDPTRKIVSKRSTDGGILWGDETVVYDSIYDDSVFSPCVTSTGAIVIIIRSFDISNNIINHGVIRSQDNGYTWTSFSKISIPSTAIIVNKIIEIPNKGLMAGWGDRPYTFEILWSYDDGITWVNQSIITGDPNNSPLEPRFSYIGNGKIIGIGRTNEVGKGLFQMQSSDYGNTWTIYRTNITDQYWTPTAILYKNGFIDILYYHRTIGVLRHRQSHFSNIWDNPLNWSDSQIYDYGSINIADAGYPDSIFVDDRICLCVYYSGDYVNTGIYGMYYWFIENDDVYLE